MDRRMLLSLPVVAVLLLGLLAGPALADQHQRPEGFTDVDCALAVAFVVEEDAPAVFAEWLAAGFVQPGVADLPEVVGGQEDALVDAVVAFLAGIGLTLDQACSIYGADVGGFVLEFQVVDPPGICDESAPFLGFGTTVEADTVTLTWYEVTDGDEADLEGQDQFGNDVAGIQRHVDEDVPLSPDGGLFTAEVLWPGAVLDAQGEVTTWPGFAPRIEDGTIMGWDAVDDGFGWARPDAVGQVGVVATFADAEAASNLLYVTYPPPDETCEVESAQVAGVALARTGSETLYLLVGGALLLGLGIVAVRRTRPKQGLG